MTQMTSVESNPTLVVKWDIRCVMIVFACGGLGPSGMPLRTNKNNCGEVVVTELSNFIWELIA